VDLHPVADDAGVGEQSPALARAVARHHRRIESFERATERVLLAQNGEPREAGLIDLERQSLEQRRVVAERKAVLAIVVGPVIGVPGRDVAVRSGHASRLYSKWRAAVDGGVSANPEACGVAPPPNTGARFSTNARNPSAQSGDD